MAPKSRPVSGSSVRTTVSETARATATRSSFISLRRSPNRNVVSAGRQWCLQEGNTQADSSEVTAARRNFSGRNNIARFCILWSKQPLPPANRQSIRRMCLNLGPLLFFIFEQNGPTQPLLHRMSTEWLLGLKSKTKSSLVKRCRTRTPAVLTGPACGLDSSPGQRLPMQFLPSAPRNDSARIKAPHFLSKQTCDSTSCSCALSDVRLGSVIF